MVRPLSLGEQDFPSEKFKSACLRDLWISTLYNGSPPAVARGELNRNDFSMLNQLLVGGAVSACNIAIHALVMTLVVRVAHAAATKPMTRPSLRLTGVMIVTVL